MTDVLRYEVADNVATVTMHRPEAMNALDLELKVALRDTLRQAADDPRVRAVVLTGAGRAFCVGQDLRQHAEKLVEDPKSCWTTVREHYNPIVLALATMPKPVIAAVNGVAAGAGAAFAFACDFRVVADTAGFNLAFSAVGLSADSGASWTLPRLVGHAKATELLMLPHTVPAAQAAELGLVTKLVPADQVLPEAQALARSLAAGPTVAYAAIKQSLVYSAAHDLEESLAFEDEMQTRAGLTEDHRGAVDAFLRKEKPSFQGR
ncbi:enoyl-CoA hydratase [Carbonactinospora thermoautotrophica]|uniref:Enoyl-CoA hydratase n=1 Tax=Carbonactinospora thermoautotrophica TaxID=1469144 RepID=A0A132NFE0_9ACTN|nr:enoyl-CoA hydratase-related protein [Carbonactinospora thermoautotrophica]KWX04960.1 enoyl-CoA hydratase [Carbonactinospora thermoautotrophica]KWX08828.1 enoyl-CoA hydratase [Carbonactinospora thermoautotrophica]